MMRRRTTKEVNLLVELAGQDHEYLTSTLTSTKTKAMVDEKRKVSIIPINDLSVDNRPFLLYKGKCKWFDVKSLRKKAVACYKKGCSKTGGGVSKADMLCDIQLTVSKLPDSVNMDDVPAAD